MNKRRIIITIGMILLLIAIGTIVTKRIQKETPTPVKTSLLLEHEEYKDIKIENVKKIIITKYTEGGDDKKELTTQEEIERIFNALNSIEIGKETKQTCEDNTIVYELELKNNESKKIEIECDWVIINSKRYEIK